MLFRSWTGYTDGADEGYLAAQQASALARGRGRVGMHYGNIDVGPRSYNHQALASGSPLTTNRIFSAASSDSYDSDTEVLPLAPTAATDATKRPSPPRMVGGGSNSGTGTAAGAAGAAQVGEDGKWFQALDERYLLPLFSNATASRTFYARKARRASGVTGLGIAGSGSRLMTPAESEDEEDGGPELDLTPAAASRSLGYVGSPPPTDENAQEIPRPMSTDASRIERGLGSPMLRRDSEGLIRDRTS